jgi:signal transduction histidine kinase
VLTAILASLTVVLGWLAQRRKQLFAEQKSDFLTTVSHELKTPLASIRVMAETLGRKLQPGVSGPDYPARIVREIDGLAGLVENILSFNRLDKGRWVARKSRVDLEELITDLVPELSAAEGRVIELATEGLEGRALEADPELTKLLFANLIRNACRYNARDPVKVTARAVPSEQGLIVEISDNGIGIPEADRPKLFTEFVRAGRRPADRTVPGSGLGLAIAKRVMALHSGTIQIKDSSDEGTTFELRFG